MSQDGNFSDEVLLREQDAARFLSVSPRTLQAWRYRGGGPVYVQISIRAVRYRLSDLRRWTQQRLRQNTAEEQTEKTNFRDADM
jgi:predicted DNA-binding transcriptional regulator AlpA